MNEKIVYRGNDTPFYNSQCLFVEYHDVIAMPWFTMLAFTKNSNAFNHIFRIDEISEYDLTGLLEWYIYRKYRNVFKSIGVIDTINMTEDGYDIMLEKAMAISNDLYRIPTNLKFLSSLRLLLTDTTMIKEVIIYSEKNEPMIEDTLKQYFSKLGTKVKYMNGDFENIIKSIPNDSTYVFSDIEKINTLVKNNKINFSCILIANGLRYNYTENDNTKLKIDLDELSKQYVFKYSFFDNFNLDDVISNNIMQSELKSIDNGVNE